MEIDILYFIQEWYGDHDFARINTSSRHLARYGEGPVAQSFVHFMHSRKQNLTHLRKASWCRRLDRGEIRTEHRLYIGEVEQPDSPDISIGAPCTDSDSDDFDFGAIQLEPCFEIQVNRPRMAVAASRFFGIVKVIRVCSRGLSWHGPSRNMRANSACRRKHRRMR